MVKRLTAIATLLVIFAVPSAQITSANLSSWVQSSQGNSQSETKGQRRKKIAHALYTAQVSRTHDKYGRVATITSTVTLPSGNAPTPTTLSLEYDAQNNVQAAVSDKGYRFEYNEKRG